MKNTGNNPVPTLRAVLLLILISMVLIPLLSCSKGDSRITSYGLSVENLVVSKEKDGPAADPALFAPTERIFIRFDLSKYQLDSQGNLWIQEDLIMKDESGQPVLTRQNLIDDRVPPPKGATSVPINNTVTLFDTSKPGKYTIEINVRDKIGGGAVYIETKITIAAKTP